MLVIPYHRGGARKGKNTMNTMQKRYVRELLRNNNDITKYDELSADAVIALLVMDVNLTYTADTLYEIFQEKVDAFINKIRQE